MISRFDRLGNVEPIPSLRRMRELEDEIKLLASTLILLANSEATEDAAAIAKSIAANALSRIANPPAEAK